MESERAQSTKAQVDLKVSFDRVESFLKKQGYQLDEKDQKIAEWEKRYNLAKYSGALGANDQTLLRFPNAKPFVKWLDPPADKPKVAIEDDDDEAS